ncbi:putative tRNA N6-adenosine threonylcarbamoyltransferase [Pleodorina starrii]|nr:putative tRNA N6-adenosine threonylcarbamoyltransferase [Pleodorina starrii]
MAQSGHAAAVVPVTAYRYSEKNVFSLLHQSDGLDIPLIYDSEHTFAALDKYPVARGHALLIVKHPAATLLDTLPPAVAQATMEDLQALARAVQRATNCAGLRITQTNGPAAGQTVPQLHFHIIPVYNPDPSSSSSSSSSAPQPSAVSAAPGGAAPAGQREQLLAADAGPLLAHIRNVLPERYAPGYHIWAANEGEMEALGWALQQACAAPGTVLALSGHLGAGKSTISRGFVRAFVRDPLLEVPSPTFLLCLSYQDDTAYDSKAAAAGGADGGSSEAAAAAAPEAPPPEAAAEPPSPGGRALCVHHMDPYRLGTKNDKMAGLIDFDAAFRREVCLIEWPDKMPAAVMEMAMAGLAVDVSGMGAQASGRLVSLTPLGDRFKPPPPKSGKKGGGKGAAAATAGKQPQPPAQTASASSPGAEATEAPPASCPTPDDVTGERKAEAAEASGSGRASGSRRSSGGGSVNYEALLRSWRQSCPASLPPADVAWRGASSMAGGGDAGADALAGRRGGGGGAAAASTINASAAAALAAGDPSQWVVLGIESSCDDTAAAVVRGDGSVLSHQIASQTGLHEQYGGVKPDVARQAHAAAIEATVDSALRSAGVEPSALTAVAVTAGPGLALCLQVGVQYGLNLATRHGLPYIPVHHMEAHAMMTRLPSVNETPMQFPSLLLLVSGGHNMLVLCEGVGRHRIIGTTLDDSVGECFDKIARVAGITAVPGGPHLERLAASARPGAHTRYPLTMPMSTGAQKDSCNFSFSGLKTQVMTLINQKRKELGLPDLPPPPAIAAAAAAAAAAASSGAGDMETDAAEAAAAATSEGNAAAAAPAAAVKSEEEAARRVAAEVEFSAAVADIAASFQRIAVRFLQQRTRRALQWLKEDATQQLGTAAAATGDAGAAAAAAAAADGAGGGAQQSQQQHQQQPGFVRSLVVAGGVAANSAVRAGLSEVAAEFGLPCVYPPVRYCTDNGLMVAWTGVERLKMGLYQQPPRGMDRAPESHVQVIPRWPIGPMDPRSTANKGRAHIKLLH